MSYMNDLRHFVENDLPRFHSVDIETMRPMVFEVEDYSVGYELKDEHRSTFWFVISHYKNGKTRFINFDVRSLAEFCSEPVPGSLSDYKTKDRLGVLVEFIQLCRNKNPEQELFALFEEAMAIPDEVPVTPQECLIEIATRMAQELQDFIGDATEAGCDNPLPGTQALLDEWEAAFKHHNQGDAS